MARSKLSPNGDQDSIGTGQPKRIEAARAAGKMAALTNRPLEGDKPEAYLAGIIGDYRALLSEALRHGTANQQKLLESEHRTLEENRKVTRERNEKTAELRRVALLEREGLPIEHFSQGSDWWKWALGILCAGFEGYYTEPAAQMFHPYGNNIVRACVFVFLTAIFLGVGHLLVGLFRQTQETPHKWMWRGAVLGVLGGTFYGLGVMRISYINNIGMTTMQNIKATSSLPLHPIYYLLLSTMLMGISAWCAFSLKTSEQKEQGKRAKELDDHIRNLGRQIEESDQRLDSYPDLLHATEVRKAQVQADAERTTARITAMFQSAVNAYRETNLAYRTDRVRPTSFDEIVSLD